FSSAWENDTEYAQFGLAAHFFDANTSDDLIVGFQRRCLKDVVKSGPCAPRRAIGGIEGRRIRLGYFCSYYTRPDYTFILDAILRNHSRDTFDVVLITEGPVEPETARRLGTHHVTLDNVSGVLPHKLLDHVVRSEFDVLIDCDGPFTNRGGTKANAIFYDECA